MQIDITPEDQQSTAKLPQLRDNVLVASASSQTDRLERHSLAKTAKGVEATVDVTQPALGMGVQLQKESQEQLDVAAKAGQITQVSHLCSDRAFAC